MLKKCESGDPLIDDQLCSIVITTSKTTHFPIPTSILCVCVELIKLSLSLFSNAIYVLHSVKVRKSNVATTQMWKSN